MQFWSKQRVATPCFDHLIKMGPVVKVTCKTIKNLSRYLGYKLINIYRLLHIYKLLHSYRLLQSYRLLCCYRLLCSYRLLQIYRLLHSHRLLHSYRLQRSSVKMNGFNSKVICRNSSVTIWEILFHIAILIIHHKYRGGFATTRAGGFVQRPWYTPSGRTERVPALRKLMRWKKWESCIRKGEVLLVL